ncbi:MAG: fused MFS/spermidine synthase [Vicinamibacterales bacterium]
MSSRWVLYAAYTLSGAAGLIYEVAWTRLLGLHLGSTTAAVSTILAAYMGGMALGALAGGRMASSVSPRAALQLYAGVEGAVALSAIVLPWVMSAFDPLLMGAYAGGRGGVVFSLMRLAAALLSVTPPAFLMGAAFPVAARSVLSSAARAGAEAGGLYAVNTIGAAAGALAAGFFVLPALGLRLATMTGVALNMAAAGAALGLALRQRHGCSETSDAARPQSSGSARGAAARAAGKTKGRPKRAKASPAKALGSAPATAAHPALAAIALCVSGLAGMCYEVVWTRVLVLVIGPTTYAFSAMLGAFIGGIALGAVVGSRVAAHVRRPVAWLAGALMLTTVGAASVAPVVNRLPVWAAEAAASPGASLFGIVLGQSVLVAAILLPVTVALGAMFPLGIALAARNVEQGPRVIAFLYLANTSGAIAGSLLGGLVLIPRLGLRGAVSAAAIAALGGALTVSVAGLATRARAAAASVLAAASFFCLLIGPEWDAELLAAGAYKYAPYVTDLDLVSALKAGTLLYHEDGAAGTVTVRRVAGVTSLAIDGKVDASNGGDMLTQKLLAHLPMLMHGSPDRVMIIGLGSGVTVGAALRHPASEVEVVEISPEVVRASRFFEKENGKALADPRARLVVGDGRTHLALGGGAYDVIISEPSNPWMSGMAALFTTEFFDLVRRRLGPGGLFCQWAHTYDMRDEDLRSIVATFTDVFPGAALFLIGESDVLLVGGTEPATAHMGRIAATMRRPGVAEDLAEAGVADSFSLLSLYVAGGRQLEGYAAGASRQSDDRLALEYSAPSAIYGRSTNENLQRLLELRDAEVPPAAVRSAVERAGAREWANRGRMLLGAQAWALAYDSLARAVQQASPAIDALDHLERAAGAGGKVPDAIRLLERLAAGDPSNVAVRLALSRLCAAEGAIEEALAWADAARDLSPGALEPIEQAASVAADAGDVARLEPLVDEMAAKWPDRPAASYYAAVLRFRRGDFAAAATMAEAAGRADPRHARAWTIAGAARASLGQVGAAREAFERSLAVDPRSAPTYANLALLELNSGNAEHAARVFAEALAVDPHYSPAIVGLAEALEREGHHARASRLRARSGTARNP